MLCAIFTQNIANPAWIASMNYLPFFIANRYFRKRKGNFSAFIIRLSVVATAISVAVMLLAIAIITGFKQEIRQKIFSFWGHVIVADYAINASNLITTSPITYDLELVKEIQQLPYVAQVTPFIVRPGIIRVPEAMEGIRLKGIPEQFQFTDKVEFIGSEKLNFQEADYAKEIILSTTTAARLQVEVGDTVQLYFMDPGSMQPRIRKLRVPALYHTGMDEIDRNYALCDIRLLQRINNWAPNHINGYQVDLHDAAYMDTAALVIFKEFTQPPLYTYTMRELFGNLFDWLGLQDINAKVVLLIMASVAVINLAVALLILIVEQARLIGLLHALGMNFRQMMMMFLYYAAIIASIGILAGNMLAVTIYFLQDKFGFIKLDEATYYMKQVPMQLYPGQIIAINLGTLILCVLCMLLPVLYIRSIQPTKVLQFR
jgi:lipoprotein-releasing system permease protein